MKKLLRNFIIVYWELCGFLSAVLFFILALPVMIFLRLTGLDLEKDW